MVDWYVRWNLNKKNPKTKTVISALRTRNIVDCSERKRWKWRNTGNLCPCCCCFRFHVSVSLPLSFMNINSATHWNFILIFCLHLWYVDVPRQEIKPVPQQWPKPQDSAKSLTCWATRELRQLLKHIVYNILILFWKFWGELCYFLNWYPFHLISYFFVF